MRIGIDSGGTFTDFVVLDDDGKLASFKLRSMAPAAADTCSLSAPAPLATRCAAASLSRAFVEFLQSESERHL